MQLPTLFATTVTIARWRRHCSVLRTYLGWWMYFWLPVTKVFHHAGSLTQKKYLCLNHRLIGFRLHCLFASTQHCLLSTSDLSQQLLRQFWGSADSRVETGTSLAHGGFSVPLSNLLRMRKIICAGVSFMLVFHC